MTPPDKLIQTDESAMDEMGLFSKHAQLEGKDVLEIGCGYGKYTVRLAPLAKSIVGTDMSEAEIGRAVSTLPEDLKEKVEYKLMPSTDLPFQDGSFDTILLAFVFHEIPHEDQEKSLREIHRVLRKGGQVVLIDPTPYSPFHRFVRIFKPGEDHGWRVERSNARIILAVEKGLFQKEEAIEFHKTFEYPNRETTYAAVLGNWARVAAPRDDAEKGEWKKRIDTVLGAAMDKPPIVFHEYCQLITLRKA